MRMQKVLTCGWILASIGTVCRIGKGYYSFANSRGEKGQ
jgi:hypothetical protein